MRKNTFLAFLCITSFVIILNSCSNDPSAPESLKDDSVVPSQQIIQVNDDSKFPNERSELALYMRNLYNDLKANKKGISNKNEPLKIEWALKYANLKSAKPTDSKDAGPVFEAFADKFLFDLKAFEYSDDSNRTHIYNGMIQSCLDCHQEHCMGPMTSIRKLRFD